MKLIFQPNTYIQTIPYLSFPLSIVQGNCKNSIIPLLVSKYVNVCFNIQSCEFDFCTYSPWWDKEKVVSTHNISIDKTLYNILNVDIIQIIKTLLDNNYFVYEIYKYSACDEKNIVAKNQEDYILIGYDDGNCIFNLIKCLDDGTYRELSVTYDEYKQILININRNTIDLYACRIINEPDGKLNREWIIEELKDYIFSENSKFTCCKNIKFGLNATLELVKHIEENLKNSRNITVKHLKLYMEHKNIMKVRLKYLFVIRIIKDNKIVSDYEALYEKLQIVYDVFSRNEFSNKVFFCEQICKIMNDIFNYEKNVLPVVLDNIIQSENIIFNNDKNDIYKLQLNDLIELRKKYSREALEAYHIFGKDGESRYDFLLESIGKEIDALNRKINKNH